jgi:hypothetical protein
LRSWDERRLGLRLAERVSRGGYDLVIVLKGEAIPADIMEGIARSGGPPLVNWLGDSPLRFPRLRRALKSYSALAIWDSAYLPTLRERGARSVFFLPAYAVPEAMPPEESWPAAEPRYPLTFVGTWSRDREEVLTPLLPLGLRVWGNGWRKFSSLPPAVTGTELPYRRMLRVLADSRLTVNVHHPQGINDANWRTFEALGAGAALVDEPHLDTVRFFRPGEHFISWRRGEDDLAAVAAAALKEPAALREMGKRARAEVWERHLVRHRWRSFFRTLAEMKILGPHPER